MLDSAAEQMMVHKDFQATFDACEKGLQSLANLDEEDERCAELKAAFCILGIQALAELNQWHGVLSWVLQQYECTQNVPAKIMQMCILLYSKVGEAAVMQEAAEVWLHSPSSCTAPGFRTVAELHLLHVLLPLGQLEEARQLIGGPVGGAAFTEEQRKNALDAVDEREEEIKKKTDSGMVPGSEIPTHFVSRAGSVIHKVENMIRFLYRKVLRGGSGSFSLRTAFLLAVLLYMLFFRMDPALPSSFIWISKLLQLLKQTWRSMFALHHHSKGL